MSTYSDYDTFAWVYNKHWGNQFTPTALSVIEKLVLPKISSNASILDLCCGTGQLARLLSERGYTITGIDGSAEMLKYAKENAAEVRRANALSGFMRCSSMRQRSATCAAS